MTTNRTRASSEWTANKVGERLDEAAALSLQEAFDWLAWLPPTDAELVWSRAQRHRWKMICWRFGISRATANRRRQQVLEAIARRLNGETGNLHGCSDPVHPIRRETFSC